MSEEADLDRVIKSLQRLQIEHRQLAQREEELLNRASELQERIERRGTNRSEGEFKVGDRVFITNRITHVGRGQAATQDDRAAVVTRLYGRQIHVRTNNGHETWRIKKNLRRDERAN